MSDAAVASDQPKRAPFGSRVWRKRLLRNAVLQKFASTALYQFMRLTHVTQRFSGPAPRYSELIEPHAPVIIALWHGQHFLVPFMWPKEFALDALISKNADAEINALILKHMGLGTVRGSGGRDAKQKLDRGGAKALLELRRSLAAGRNVAMIADISHSQPRWAGEGIVTLARISGRPIVPVAYATSRHYVFEKSWDKATLNLPFGRRGFAVGQAIYVGAGDDMAAKQAQVTEALNDVTRRAASNATLKSVASH